MSEKVFETFFVFQRRCLEDTNLASVFERIPILFLFVRTRDIVRESANHSQ